MTRLFFRRAGSGPTIILVHGFCGASGYWLPAMITLAHHFDVVALDLPGFGRSNQMPECKRIEDLAASVIELADSLDVRRFGVVGHSMGGFIVQQLICAHAERLAGAVLYGNGLRIDPTKRFESAERTVERLRQEGVAATADRVVPTWFVDGKDSPSYEFCRHAGEGMTLAAGIAAMEACHAVDLRERLGHAKTPALVLVGDRERTFPPEMAVELRQAIPGANLCVLPHCAHAAHLESPDLFNAVVLDFFLSAFA
jgi:pimeloyl-ACP methyl ester carboxylesterase